MGYWLPGLHRLRKPRSFRKLAVLTYTVVVLPLNPKLSQTFPRVFSRDKRNAIQPTPTDSMSSKAYFPVSIPDLKRDLLSNTHSFRIRLKGREFKVFPTNEISSSRDQLRARCRSSDYVKDRVLLYILLEGRTFDVKNCHEELTYWEISMDHSLQTELGALIQLSTLLIYFQDRKLDVTRAIDESWGFCPQTSPHIFPLERQLLFQIMYKGRMFDVTLPLPLLSRAFPLTFV